MNGTMNNPTSNNNNYEKVIIRKTETNDVVELHRIIQTCYRSDASWTNENKLVAGERISKEQLINIIESGKDALFSAVLASDTHNSNDNKECDVVEHKVIGCIKIELWMNHTQDLPPNSAMFGLLAVDPAIQSKGVGSKLMNHAQWYVKEELKIPTGIIWVINHRSDIQKWYQRLGFQWNGSTKEFVMPDLAKLDDTYFLVYEKQL